MELYKDLENTDYTSSDFSFFSEEQVDLRETQYDERYFEELERAMLKEEMNVDGIQTALLFAA